MWPCLKIFYCHEYSNEYSMKDWCWSWNSNTLATWCEELTHLKRLWCWEWLKVGGEGDDRGWDGWMASPTRWTWVWASSGGWWWTGKPGVLQSMRSQRVGHDWAWLSDWTELNWAWPRTPDSSKGGKEISPWTPGSLWSLVYIVFFCNQTHFSVLKNLHVSLFCKGGLWSFLTSLPRTYPVACQSACCHCAFYAHPADKLPLTSTGTNAASQ